jgi:hypothetical protein
MGPPREKRHVGTRRDELRTEISPHSTRADDGDPHWQAPEIEEPHVERAKGRSQALKLVIRHLRLV